MSFVSWINDGAAKFELPTAVIHCFACNAKSGRQSAHNQKVIVDKMYQLNSIRSVPKTVKNSASKTFRQETKKTIIDMMLPSVTKNIR